MVSQTRRVVGAFYRRGMRGATPAAPPFRAV